MPRGCAAPERPAARYEGRRDDVRAERGKDFPDDTGGGLQETPPTVPAQPTPAAQPSSAVRHVRSADLFGGAREVVIEHEHHRYRLKMTSRGGLILNK